MKTKKALGSIKAALAVALAAIFFQSALGQSTGYSYKAQKAFIPSDLGAVYVGMPFKDFAKAIDISKAEADTRFDFVSLAVPFKKGVIDGLSIRVGGLTRAQIDQMKRTVEEEVKTETGSYTRRIEYIDPSKITGIGFVYAYYIGFSPDFDLKSWVIRTYGADGEVRKPGDEFHFFDVQWNNKKTSDGLVWLIRSFHEDEGKSLQLLGRISGTEWAVD